MASSPDDYAQQLQSVPEAILAAWYVALNKFQWPQDCLVPCPDAWTSATTDCERMVVAADLWFYLKAHTTEQARSRAWWLLALHRTEQEWRAYWALPVCPTCQLRHANGMIHSA